MDAQHTSAPGEGCGEVLSQVIRKLSPLLEKRATIRRDVLSMMSDIPSRVVGTPPSPEEFSHFCKGAHDFLVKFDSPVRTILLRILRFALQSREHCQCFIEEELHWIVVVCLEREREFLAERVQALKLIRKFLSLAGDLFPSAFARSLVAIASHKDEHLRRVSMETLRELAVENPKLVAAVNGLSVLLDAVLEPAYQDLAEPILVSLMYLLNDPKTRKFIRPYLDLHTVVSVSLQSVVERTVDVLMGISGLV
jgi:Rapamycin-insensitive companion of mTOR, N-term